MKKAILLLSLTFGALSAINAQVTSVKYLIEYNESSLLYDCKIYIADGEADSYIHRIQFNAQFTVVVPTGTELAIEGYHNPIKANQNYTGTEPLEWDFGLKAVSPPEQPESDFQTILPRLGPAAAYNNLYVGDTITLFSLLVDVDPCENEIEPFDNLLDLDIIDLQIDVFDCGFTIGSINQLYDGNLLNEYDCVVGLFELQENDIMVYPNPAGDYFYVTGESIIESISIYSLSNQKVDEIKDLNGNRMIQLSTEKLHPGIYIIAIESEGQVVYEKLIVE